MEKTTELVGYSGALAGVNASFFALGATCPGDPTGLGLYAGKLLSEPAATTPNEVDLVVNAATNSVLMGHLRWSGPW